MLASTLTTVLVFVPIVFIEEEAGQLYSDIAIAVSASILASMLVAITVVPTASARCTFAPRTTATRRTSRGMPRTGCWSGIDWLTRRPSAAHRHRDAGRRAPASAAFVWLTPPAEYLPEGEEPKIFARMNAPPGYNLETMSRIGDEVQDYFLPFLEHTPDQFERGETEVPALHYFNLSIEAGSACASSPNPRIPITSSR